MIPPFILAMMSLNRVERFGERKMFYLAPRVIVMRDEDDLSPESLVRLVNEGSIVPRCTVEEMRIWLDESRSKCEHWRTDGIEVTTAFSDDYPDSLKEIRNHPFFLYYKGDIAPLSQTNVAIVGTRKPTDAGSKQAKAIARHLVTREVGIVSGLALGCDTAGHEGALDGGGYTCAVLAHGLDIVTPAANRSLAERILEGGGALVSEHPSGVPPTRRYYVMRNRIQSALSTHVIVIETTLNGGTMHTARFADEQDRSLGVLEFPEDQSEDDFRIAVTEITSNLGGYPLGSLDDVTEFVIGMSEEE